MTRLVYIFPLFGFGWTGVFELCVCWAAISIGSCVRLTEVCLHLGLVLVSDGDGFPIHLERLRDGR